MTSVTFPVALGGDGSTVTDDASATTGLANGGHRTRFVPALAQAVAVMNGAVAQTAASQAAASAAAGAALWVSGTTYAIGACVWSPVTYLVYRRKTAGAGTTDPSGDATNWQLAVNVAPPLIVVTGPAAACVASYHYELTNAAASTATLPASPSAGDIVYVTIGNGRSDNVIARNGSTIMGLSEDMTVDSATVTVVLRFMNNDWRLM